MTDLNSPTPLTPPPVRLQPIDLSISLNSVIDVTILEKRDVSYNVDCENSSDQQKEVSCPIADSEHRRLNSVLSVDSPYQVYSLTNFTTSINLNADTNYVISSNFLGIAVPGGLGSVFDTSKISIPGGGSLSAADQSLLNSEASSRSSDANRDPEVYINVDASWQLRHNTLISERITTSPLKNKDNIVFNLAPEACLKLNVTDMVYRGTLHFSSTTSLSSTSLSGLEGVAKRITSNKLPVSEMGNAASFPSQTNITANFLISQVTGATPIPCSFATNAPTLPPTISTGLSRFGVITSENGQNSVGSFFGFNSGKVNQVFSYNNFDKYAVLYKGRECFKVKIWVVIPAAFIIIIFPLWVDADIITAILGALQTALGAAGGLLGTAVNTARQLRTQVSATNYLEFRKRQLAIAKGIATKEGLTKLATIAKKHAERAFETLKDVADVTELLDLIEAIQKIIQLVLDTIDTLSNLDIIQKFTDPSSLKDPATLRSAAESIKTIVKIIETTVETLLELIDLLPDEFIVKQKVKEIVADGRELINLLQTLPQEAIQRIISTNLASPKELVKEIVKVIFDKRIIRKFIKISNNVNDITNVYELLLNQLKQTGEKVFKEGQNITREGLKTAVELQAIGQNQTKTALEQSLEALADDVAAEIDALAGAAASALGLNQAENLANEGIDAALSGISSAADALGSAAEGIEEGKRDQIKGVINQFLVNDIDIYKITRIGKFDENHPNESHILVNDLSGTKIFSKDGDTELFNRADFCKHPFIDMGNTRSNSYGCQSSKDPCGTHYNCQEKNYWYGIFKYRVSFDFYINHDLSKGGVVVGDFDGDGISDIMCHYPSFTKNYAEITKEPLKS